MTLFELIHDTKWDDTADVLCTYYKLEEDDIEAHFKAFVKIKSLDLIPSNMRILLTKVVETWQGETETYWDIHGKDGSKIKDSSDYENFKDIITEERANQEESYALEFKAWKEWLGMAIDPATLNNPELPRAEMLAHILYEMTYIGYNEIEVQSKKEQIDARAEEALESTKEKPKRPTPYNN